MTEPEPYPTARGVESAIKEAAKKQSAADPALNVNKRIELEYFNRFLSRVFSEGADSEWVLKGGASILARVTSTRSTRDIDLFRRGFSVDQALSDLKRLASVDLGDHFRFEYAGHVPSIGTDAQPYVEGCRVSFAVFLGLAPKGSLQIDLAVGSGMTSEASIMEPATALDLPRLISNPYRLYPVVDQVADKVCATMTDHGGRPSSREKDLVDLVVFATTQRIDGTALRLAIDVERRRRRMEPFERFVIPAAWGPGYVKLSRSVPHCAQHRTVDLATELAERLINPALIADADGRMWVPDTLSWV